MELFFRISLLIAGVINFLPSLITLMPERIAEAYGVEVSDVNMELLLRHRALMFGVLGGVMIYAAITKKNYTLATVMGLISMVGFVLLYFYIGGINAELYNVLMIDIVAIVLLLIGYVAFVIKSKVVK